MTYSDGTTGVAETQGPRGGHHFVRNNELCQALTLSVHPNTTWLVGGDEAASLGPWAEIAKEDKVDSSDGLMRWKYRYRTPPPLAQIRVIYALVP